MENKLDIASITRKDIRAAAGRLSDDEARFLVKYYYIMQEDRIRSNAQVRSMDKEEVPNVLLSVLADQSQNAEGIIKKALDDYTSKHPVGRWLKEIYGIGPVIAAGLLAYIDIERAPTAGHIQSFAGLNPNMVWGKGQKRPFCPDLKKICWHAGQSFMKFSGKDECVYGKLYLERKKYEQLNNDDGKYADYAAKMLREKNYAKNTDTYKCLSSGKLSPAHIDARARRWVVKIFLSHLHQEWYRWHFKKDAPAPYAIAILGHAHKIDPTHVIED